jgi:hypothetical protein
VQASGLSAVKITGTDIARTIHRKVLRFAQDDGDDSIKR